MAIPQHSPLKRKQQVMVSIVLERDEVVAMGGLFDWSHSMLQVQQLVP